MIYGGKPSETGRSDLKVAQKSGSNGNGGTICCFALFSPATSVADTTLRELRHGLKKARATAKVLFLKLQKPSDSYRCLF